MKSIEDAVSVLRQGEIVGVPTETVYGLAVDPRLPGAVRKLYEVKRRPGGRPISLLVASIAQAERIARVTEAARETVSEHWPGPLTVILRWHRPLPDLIGDHERETVGLRVPDHPVALALLESAGPLAVTSANRSGRPPALDHTEAEMIFGADVAAYLDGSGVVGEGSTVVDFTVEPPELLREGPITLLQ